MERRNLASKLNVGEDDEMVISGHRRSYIKTFFTSILALLSCGLLLLLLSWRRSINMLLTHTVCSLDEAEKILLVNSYGQQYISKVIRPPEQVHIKKKTYSYFYNKKIKYIWDPSQEKFVKVGALDVHSCDQFYGMSGGLSTTDAIFRLQFYGRNSIFIEVKPFFHLILREIRSPFYIYQMFIVVVWLIQVYYQFAVCILLLSTISIAATVWETRKQSGALRDAVRTEATVTVIRDGKETEKPSDELVPGDVIIVPQYEFTMVCDAVLLNGNCVVNESMLTGESIPITKVPIADVTTPYLTDVHKKSTLFCGTQILHCRSTQEEDDVKAVVYRTGFTTSKGELVRAILYPNPVNFKLYSDLFKCMIIFFLMGIIPMAYTAIVWIRLDAAVQDIIIIVVDVITFLVPPLLPAVMTSINAHAQKRLRKHGIYCLNSKYINFCGALDVVCFDKTGTLTEDSLDFSGCIPVENGAFTPAVKECGNLKNDHLLKALASCHSLNNVRGKILGHTLDLKLIEAAGWVLEESKSTYDHRFQRPVQRVVSQKNESQLEELKPSIAIVKQFPFESFLRRMSVVTITEGCHQFQVFLKGAPELVASLCYPETVPENFKEILEMYTRQGYRVLAVGSRTLPDETSWEDVSSIKREELERDLYFQGLIVLQNRLKPETVPALNHLRNASIRALIITGDNLLTAVTVGRDCGMIEELDAVITVEAEMVNSSSGEQRLQVEYNYAKFPGLSEKLSIMQNGTFEDMYLPSSSEGKVHIAIEGVAFNLIRLHDTQLLNKIALMGTIFARMLPEHKLYLIQTLQSIGYQVGMCGDGANDCGALKAANAGVSLSVAEASVASAFTAIEPNIQCIPTLIREGRAALASTFGVFRYMVCYCYVLLSAVLILFWDGQKPTDGGYVMIDIVLNLLPPILFGSTGAYHRLVKRPPTRSIISILPLFSIISFTIFQSAVYAIAYEYCKAQPWFQPFTYNKAKTHYPEASYSGTAVLCSNMMSYVIAAVIFSPGPPYRKNLTSNKLYTGVVAIMFLLVSLLTIHPPDVLAKFVNLKKAPFIEYHMVLYVLSLTNFILSYIWEVYFIQSFLFDRVLPAIRKLRGPIHKYEKIAAELKEFKWPPRGIVRQQSSEPEMDARRTWDSDRTFDTPKTFVSLNILTNSEDYRSPESRSVSRTEMIPTRAKNDCFVTFRDGRYATKAASSDTGISQDYV